MLKFNIDTSEGMKLSTKLKEIHGLTYSDDDSPIFESVTVSVDDDGNCSVEPHAFNAEV